MVKWMLALIGGGWVVLELWLLLEMSRSVGVGWTLLWVLLSAAGGIMLLRVAGLQALFGIHNRLRAEELPIRELVEMVLVLTGAAMLIMPGLLSDAVGLALALPPVRWLVKIIVLARIESWLPTPTVQVRTVLATEEFAHRELVQSPVRTNDQ